MAAVKVSILSVNILIKHSVPCFSLIHKHFTDVHVAVDYTLPTQLQNETDYCCAHLCHSTTDLQAACPSQQIDSSGWKLTIS